MPNGATPMKNAIPHTAECLNAPQCNLYLMEQTYPQLLYANHYHWSLLQFWDSSHPQSISCSHQHHQDIPSMHTLISNNFFCALPTIRKLALLYSLTELPRTARTLRLCFASA